MMHALIGSIQGAICRGRAHVVQQLPDLCKNSSFADGTLQATSVCASTRLYDNRESKDMVTQYPPAP